MIDLIESVPDELWTEVRDIVEETGIKTIPKKKKVLIQKDISTSMFIAVLFVVTKIWKPHKFSLIEIGYRKSTESSGEDIPHF